MFIIPDAPLLGVEAARVSWEQELEGPGCKYLSYSQSAEKAVVLPSAGLGGQRETGHE